MPSLSVAVENGVLGVKDLCLAPVVDLTDEGIGASANMREKGG
jgi:hypothetical protein